MTKLAEADVDGYWIADEAAESMGIQPGDALYLEFENGEDVGPDQGHLPRALERAAHAVLALALAFHPRATRRRPAADVPD